jgi:hypothetical protein
VPISPRGLAGAVAIAVLASVMYVVRVQTEMADFTVYRTAAIRVVQAEPLYRVEDGHYQYKYLPAFALAVAPIGWVGPETGKVAWYALSIALLAVFVAWSVRALPGRRLSTRALVWVSILLMGKFYAHELNLGQTNILLGVVLVAALLAAQQGRAALAGLLVGAGVFVKPYAIILLPWLLIAVGIEGVLSALMVLAAGLALPAAMYGWQGNVEQIVGWYRTVTDTTAPNLLVAENISLATMWAKWVGVGPLATWLAVATAVAALAVAAGTIWRRQRVTSPAYLEFGLLMLLVPLISPQGWDYVLLLATPAVLCVVDRFREMTVPWRIAAGVALAFMSFSIYDLVGRTMYSRLMAVNIVSVCALALVACLAYQRARALA